MGPDSWCCTWYYVRDMPKYGLLDHKQNDGYFTIVSLGHVQSETE